MKIVPIRNYYSYSPNSSLKTNMSKTAPSSQGAVFLSFKGHFEDTVSIIPSGKDTELEKQIAKSTGITPEKSTTTKFKSGETYVNLNGNIRGKDVYLMPAANDNPNDSLVETLLKADAAKRSAAKKVIAVLPFFPYERQEKRTETTEPISARLSMDLLKTSGVNEIISVDLHNPAIDGFAPNSMVVNHVNPTPAIVKFIESKHIPDLVVVAPDIGATKRADNVAKALKCDKAIVYKHRAVHNEAIAEDLIGDVKGKNCVIVDDILDTGGTLIEAAKLLKKNGAKDIYVCVTHGLFSKDAEQKLANSPIKEFFVTDAVPQKEKHSIQVETISIADLISDAMKKISEK